MSKPDIRFIASAACLKSPARDVRLEVFRAPQVFEQKHSSKDFVLAPPSIATRVFLQPGHGLDGSGEVHGGQYRDRPFIVKLPRGRPDCCGSMAI